MNVSFGTNCVTGKSLSAELLLNNDLGDRNRSELI